MPKTKSKTPKTLAKKSPKYSKVLSVALKELEGKKKLLVHAERALAKAKQKHEELISEVARLDMVERSLRALVEGTEPPQNVRYVYNYPQWVWQPSVYTVPNYSQPGWTFTNTPNLPNTTVTCGGLQGTNAVFNMNTSNSGSLLTANSGVSSSVGNTVTYTTGTGDVHTDSVTVDLSTYAEAVEPELEATASASNS